MKEHNSNNIYDAEESLDFMYRTARELKDEFGNLVMNINDKTFIAFSKANSRLIHSRRKSISDCQAYYSYSKPHRIVVNQSFLTSRKGWLGINWYSTDPIMETRTDGSVIRLSVFNGTRNVKGPEIFGLIALMEIVCHELAHHRTKGHAKGFKIKYARFWNHMVKQIRSGKFVIPEDEIRQLEDALASIRSPTPIACA